SQQILLSLASGSGRVRISKKNLFEKFVFHIPSLPEQQKIADFLTSIDKKITQVDQQLETMTQFKKGLLQQMFPSRASGNG
ncbi:restriction endonuclease subunit S, partial [Candidatus Marinamargulisbacteria bacterium]|nr:restriction endonuclease subunit S [Candidatus Marinamargulisbacteria bacterium]